MRRLPCPAESQWTGLAAGEIRGDEAAALLAHAAECRACSSSLKEALYLLGEAVPGEEAAGESGAEDDADGRARELAELLASRGGVRHARGWAIAAVILAAAAPAAWWLWQRAASPPLAKLAAAYSARRTIELRVPGAAHAALRVERGGRSNPTPELLESEAEIQRQLDRRRGDPGWLHATGRLAVLRWDFNQAIEQFHAAQAAGANSPEFWTDFATAYFERAEARQEPDGYEKAVELLGRALALRPRDPAALFNRAVVQARLLRRDAALRDFDECIQAERDAAWRDEAQQLAEALRAR